MTLKELVDKHGSQRFICPKCRGNTFGSSNCLSKGDMTRHCHGTFCKYQWHERDDAKHFFVVITILETELEKLLENE